MLSYAECVLCSVDQHVDGSACYLSSLRPIFLSLVIFRFGGKGGGREIVRKETTLLLIRFTSFKIDQIDLQPRIAKETEPTKRFEED